MDRLSPQIEGLLDLVSPRTGIIRRLERIPRGVDEPSPPILYHALLSNFDFRTAKPLERAAAGKGLTESEAIGGAIGEAIERYCAAHVDLSLLRRVSLADAERGWIMPEDCVLYSDAQYARPGFPHLRAVPEMEIDWMPVHELPGERTTLAPAALIYLHADAVQPGDSLCPTTSNGLAAGPDLPSAIRSGICELIERDAFLVTWANRLPAPEIDLTGVKGPIVAILDHHARFGLETRVFNITTDIPIPAMMAVSIDRSGDSPAAVVGLGCHLQPRQAVLRALFEICQVRPGETRRWEEAGRQAHVRRYEDVRTLEDHSAFFAPLERLVELDFLLNSGRRHHIDALPDRSTGSPAGDLKVCVDALTIAGCRPVFADLTTPDLSGFGIRVVRTIATGLQPMHFGHGQDRLGGRRLFEVPLSLGFGATKRSEAELNPCPHPLA